MSQLPLEIYPNTQAFADDNPCTLNDSSVLIAAPGGVRNVNIQDS